MGLVYRMKKIIIAIFLLIIDVLCTTIIGTMGLQEKLTMMVYFLPIVIDFIIIIFYCKANLKIVRSILIRLIILFVFLTFILCFAIYVKGNFFTSIIAVCVFIIVFNVFPALLFFVISFLIKNDTEH